MTLGIDMDPLTKCGVCQNTLGWHNGQPDGSLHHEFDPNGSFAAIAEPESLRKKRDAPKTPLDDAHRVASQAIKRQSDVSLRFLLVQQGILKQEDLDAMDNRLIDALALGKLVFNVGLDDSSSSTARSDGSGGAGDPQAGDVRAPEGSVRSDHPSDELSARSVGPSASQQG